MNKDTIRHVFKRFDLCLSLSNMQCVAACLRINVMVLVDGSEIYYSKDFKPEGDFCLISDAVVKTSDKLVYSDSVIVPAKNIIFIHEMSDQTNY